MCVGRSYLWAYLWLGQPISYLGTRCYGLSCVDIGKKFRYPSICHKLSTRLHKFDFILSFSPSDHRSNPIKSLIRSDPIQNRVWVVFSNNLITRIHLPSSKFPPSFLSSPPWELEVNGKTANNLTQASHRLRLKGVLINVTRSDFVDF